LCPPVTSSEGIDDDEVGRSVELSVVGSTDSGVVEVEVVLVEVDVVLVDVGVEVDAMLADVEVVADVELELEESPSPPVEPPSNSGRTKDEKTRVEVEVVEATSLIVASFPVSDTCNGVGELVLDPQLELEVEVLLVPVPVTTGPFVSPFFFPSLDFFGVLEVEVLVLVRGTSATKNPLLELALDEEDEDGGGAAISTPSPPPPPLSTGEEEEACEEITSEGTTNDEEPKEGDAEGAAPA
jgi:hypothetical protein